jgi:hypothetical protein
LFADLFIAAALTFWIAGAFFSFPAPAIALATAATAATASFLLVILHIFELI